MINKLKVGALVVLCATICGLANNHKSSMVSAKTIKPVVGPVIGSIYKPTCLTDDIYLYSGDDGLNSLALDFATNINGVSLFSASRTDKVLFPLTINQIAEEKQKQRLVGSTFNIDLLDKNGYWSGSDFCTDYKPAAYYSLDYRFNYNPDIANTKITISDIRSSSLKNGGYLGLFFNESYAVCSSIEVKFSISLEEYSSFGTSYTIDMSGKEPGQYEICIQLFKCTKYLLKYDESTGKLCEGVKLTNCLSDVGAYVARKIS